MRVLLVSDSHGMDRNIEKAILRSGALDLMIHLGDLEGSEDYLEEIAPCPVEIVAGNNDFFSGLPRERIIRLGTHNVFIVHGHNYCVNFGYDRLRAAALQKGCDYAFFGHIHRPVCDTSESVTVINPGSISMPRQADRRPTYVLLDVDKNGEIHVSFEYI